LPSRSFMLYAVAAETVRSSPASSLTKAIDLSGDWNDTDSRLVAEEMIGDVLGAPLARRFQGGKEAYTRCHRRHGSGTGQTSTSRRWRSSRNLEKELINSGRVTFVATKRSGPEVRDERADQQENATRDSR